MFSLKGGKIWCVNSRDLAQIIEMRKPEGMFLSFDEDVNMFIACANDTGDAWVEEFRDVHEAVANLLYGHGAADDERGFFFDLVEEEQREINDLVNEFIQFSWEDAT